MGHIAVIGSCAMDLTVETDRRPGAGETVMGRRLIVSPGGKGANQAVAASRLGAAVYMIGCVGDDSYGQMIQDNLEANGIDSRYVTVLPKISSGTAHITLAEGDNSIIVIKGANDLVGRAQIDQAWPVIGNADMVLLQQEIPMDTIGYCIHRCKEAGVPVILNPAPAADTPAEWVEEATYVTPNEHEASALYPGMSPEKILIGHSRRIIITRGKQGAAYGEDGKVVCAPGFSADPVDTTGAGDTFNGALAVACAEGGRLEEALRFANAAAALSIQKIGAQGGMPGRTEVEEMLLCRK